MKLYELNASLEALWEDAASVLDNGNCDVDEIDKALAYLEGQLKQAEGTHAEKCLNIACLIKNTDAEAEALKFEEERLRQRRKSAERKTEWLRGYLASNMEPGANLKDARAAIGWRKSTAVEVSCRPEDLPPVFQRTKVIVEADRAAIKAALELSPATPIAGCTLVERFNLQIK